MSITCVLMWLYANILVMVAHCVNVSYWLYANFYLVTAHLCAFSSCFLFFVTVYRLCSINHTCFLNRNQADSGVYSSPPMSSFMDLSFYYFTLGSMFPFANFCVFVSPLFSHQVHTKWFYIPAFSDFGIRENSIKIKSIFLPPYVFMNVLALSGRIYIRVQYQ